MPTRPPVSPAPPRIEAVGPPGRGGAVRYRCPATGAEASSRLPLGSVRALVDRYCAEPYPGVKAVANQLGIGRTAAHRVLGGLGLLRPLHLSATLRHQRERGEPQTPGLPAALDAARLLRETGSSAVAARLRRRSRSATRAVARRHRARLRALNPGRLVYTEPELAALSPRDRALVLAVDRGEDPRAVGARYGVARTTVNRIAQPFRPSRDRPLPDRATA